MEIIAKDPKNNLSFGIWTRPRATPASINAPTKEEHHSEGSFVLIATVLPDSAMSSPSVNA